MSSPAEARFEAAVRSYWQVRDAQAAKQIEAGKVDAGTRGSVTGGGHLNGVAALLEELFIENGFPPHTIRRTSSIELPGFYRPTKKWDLVVIDDGKLVAAIELKSQVGPSFGNNFNNRTEEAIGNAVDVWRAYEESTFGGVRQLALLRKCDGDELEPGQDVLGHFVASLLPNSESALSHSDRFVAAGSRRTINSGVASSAR